MTTGRLIMNASQRTRRTCPQGHTYWKSSDCRTCPTCEAQRAPDSGVLSTLAAPARRALEGQGLTTLAAISRCTEAQLLALHGMGPRAMATVREALAAA